MEIERIFPPDYPHLLKQIKSLPKHLDIAGTIPSDDHVFLCVIGARKYSSYGKDACSALIKGLKGYPVVIVSGLAIGIDSLAHEAALEAGLKTIAFPGSGLASGALYPASRKDLAWKIVDAGGAVVSPFPPDQPGVHWAFPYRNRLMAGISHATLIIEARKGSGTLLTAGYATEFNRDIFAVPGSIFSDLSYGPHMLIRQGAAAIHSSEDILKECGLFNPDHAGQKPFNLEALELSPDETKIMQGLLASPLSAHELIEKTSLPSHSLSVHLSQLELRDLICQNDGLYKIKPR